MRAAMAEVTKTVTVAPLEADILAEVVRLLEPYRKASSPVSATTDITRDLNLDSLAVMDFLMDLEERFDISIPLNLVPEIQTVGDLATTIARIREDA